MKKTRFSLKKTPSAKLRKAVLSLIAGLLITFFAWTADSLTSVELPQAEEPPEFYSNQTRDDLQKVYIKAIQEAKQSILLIMYGLTDNAIIHELKSKAGEGVRIKVICDAKASPYAESKLGSNVQVIKRMAKGLMHLKLLVIDETQVWIGSANFTSESLKMHGNLVMAMDSPAIGAAIYAKANTLSEFDRTEDIASQEFTFGSQQGELWFLPDSRNASVRIKEMIRSAKKTIQIAMFTWTRQDFAKEVIDAKKRGIKVEVVIDHHQGKGTCARIVEMLKNGGIPVRLSHGPGLLHHKFMMIDGRHLENGSANWTKMAFNENDDCFMILHDLTPKQKELMDNLWEVIWQESSPPDI